MMSVGLPTPDRTMSELPKQEPGAGGRRSALPARGRKQPFAASAPCTASAQELPEFGPLSRAGRALAPDLPDEAIEIIPSVVIRNLGTWLDVLDRANLDDVFDEINLRIGPACVIDVAGAVSPSGAVDGPSTVDLEQVPIIDLVRDVRAKLPAVISDDELPFSYRHGREQAEPGFRAPDTKVT
jgi:hypothetical protein